MNITEGLQNLARLFGSLLSLPSRCNRRVPVSAKRSVDSLTCRDDSSFDGSRPGELDGHGFLGESRTQVHESSSDQGTCWTLIDGAAHGDAAASEEFARRYRSAVSAYFRARWAGNRYLEELDDAVQDVFLECFREGGVLQKVDRDRSGGFRAFLYGVVRNVALRAEKRLARKGHRENRLASEVDLENPDENHLSAVFDRAWARERLREATQRHRHVATTLGEEAVRRVDVLKLRFQDDVSVNEISELWGVKPAHVYKQIAKAQAEFRQALADVVSFYHPGTPAENLEECAALRAMVSDG